MHHSNNNTRSKRSEKDPVGWAHHTLRAFVKAHEIQAGNGVEYSYSVSADRTSASILDEKGQPIETRTIADWAKAGPELRLALIGLKDIKETLESEARRQSKSLKVRFYLNVLESGKAELLVNGQPVTRDALVEMLNGRKRTIDVDCPITAAVQELGDADLRTTAGWSKIGRQCEIVVFESLGAAEHYGIEDAANIERERAYRLGIIRRPRPERAPDDVVPATAV
jgi:hypothetical protein